MGAVTSGGGANGHGDGQQAPCSTLWQFNASQVQSTCNSTVHTTVDVYASEWQTLSENGGVSGGSGGSGGLVTARDFAQLPPSAVTTSSAVLYTLGTLSVDAAGNVGAVGSLHWWVDNAAPPAPTLSSTPSSVTFSPDATFEAAVVNDDSPGPMVFVAWLTDGSGGGGSSGVQRVEGSHPDPVTLQFRGLSVGTHTLNVQAVDGANNTSPVTAYTWTVAQEVSYYGTVAGTRWRNCGLCRTRTGVPPPPCLTEFRVCGCECGVRASFVCLSFLCVYFVWSIVCRVCLRICVGARPCGGVGTGIY